MVDDSTPSAPRPRPLPDQPSLEHLRNEAKQHVKILRSQDLHVKLAAAQRDIAQRYGFSSWRRLKAHVDAIDAARAESTRVFDAARDGDLETVRRALEGGFDPGQTDHDGRTIHQVARAHGHTAIELLARQYQERDLRPPEIQHATSKILDAAEQGRLDVLGRLLDDHPELINAWGGDAQKQTALHKAAWRNHEACVRLLLAQGADVHIRDYGDNAYALHFAAESADLAIVKVLVEAGSDVNGPGDDHQLGVLGWATCFREVRRDVAEYLLGQGARLNLWSAIALDRLDDVHDLVTRDPTLLNARMSRNEHLRTPLHHAAAKNRPRIVRHLIDLGADVNTADATGATPLTTATQENADPSILAMLQQAGATLDFVAALNLKRYDLADAMLKADPVRIGPDGRDTIALHLSVARKNAESVRWLIDHGAAVNAKRALWSCNQTALHAAAQNGAVDIAGMLLDAGADPGIHDDMYDATVLGWAEYCGHPAVAELIRARGGSG
jgi:ankyrin repeat protein